MASNESKAAAKTQQSTIDKYLIKQGRKAEPEWQHGVSQRALCGSVHCPIEGHIQCQEQDGLHAAEGEAAEGKADGAEGAEMAEEAEDDYFPDVAEPKFVMCCHRMGNCLCEDTDEHQAYNQKHGLTDPRMLTGWSAAAYYNCMYGSD